jgi:hypothetical protein
VTSAARNLETPGPRAGILAAGHVTTLSGFEARRQGSSHLNHRGGRARKCGHDHIVAVSADEESRREFS